MSAEKAPPYEPPPSGPDYPPIEDLVPHGLPIRVVEEMVGWQPGKATCRLKVRAHGPFVEEGRVHTSVALEYLAQSVAACLGHEAYLGGGRIRVGMIIGVRKMEVFQPTIAVGTDIRTEVERIRGDEDVSTFRGEAFDGDTCLCVAHMTLVHPEAPPS